MTYYFPFQDGIYSLELAGDGDIKISCPSMSATQLELPGQVKDPSNGVNTSIITLQQLLKLWLLEYLYVTLSRNQSMDTDRPRLVCHAP